MSCAVIGLISVNLEALWKSFFFLMGTKGNWSNQVISMTEKLASSRSFDFVQGVNKFSLHFSRVSFFFFTRQQRYSLSFDCKLVLTGIRP